MTNDLITAEQFLEIEEMISEVVKRIETIAEQNQWRIIESFQRHKVSDVHFADSTGYGYNDLGREVLDEIYADIFGAEAAIVRPHFVSGTHAISTALFAMLRPNDHLLSITGAPYDTLQRVIGKGMDYTGTLCDWGIDYDEVPLTSRGEVDWDGVRKKIRKETKVIAIQRSRGYDLRPSFTIAQIRQMIEQVKSIREDLLVFVDNCYGEFVELQEPTHVGADLIAGSLIKNPGGGIVSTGGYIAGKRQWVQCAADRLTAPGLGGEVGAMLGQTRSIFQGLFLAPHFVGQAVRGSVFAAAVFSKLGYVTDPNWDDVRTDLIQAIHFDDEESLIDFVQQIQKSAAVDAYVVPVPGEMPGYEHPVIMAAGTFIQGGSLELSADAPLRKPYAAFMQGGLTYGHVKYAVMNAAKSLAARRSMML